MDFLELMDLRGTSPLPVDPVLREAVAAAPNSPLVRLTELKLLAVLEFGRRAAIEDREQRRIAAARSLLRTREQDLWGLHQVLLDSPAVDDAEKRRHRRAPEW
jgi:hypothetical protein